MRKLYAIVVVLLLALQAGSTAHAVRYVDADHDHDGIACALAHLGERGGTALLPGAPVSLLPRTPFGVRLAADPTVSSVAASTAWREPRAPPSY